MRSLQGGFTGEFQAAPGPVKQALQVAQLGQRGAQGQQCGAVELQHHIAPRQVLAGGQVADPVVGQVGADQCDMAGAKRTDIVARHELAAALADQVDFKFGVMVPAGQLERIVMFVPAKAMLGLGQNHFQLGGALLEKGGSACRHGIGPSGLFGMAPKYALCPSSRYPGFCPPLILF